MTMLLNTVDTYLSLQPFKNVEQLNKNTIKIRNQFANVMTLSTKKVLDVLHRYACKYPGLCYLSKGSIAKMIGISRRTVVRACNHLEKLGVIKQYELKRHNGDRRQSSNAIVFVAVKEDVIPECHSLDSLDNAQKSNNTLDTSKQDLFKKDKVAVDKSKSRGMLENIKRGMRDKMPHYIYDLLSPYFNLDDLYKVYGALIRGKANSDRNINFEFYPEVYADSIKSVILGYKRGIVKNIFAVMYTASRNTTAQISRHLNWMNGGSERVPNWLEWDVDTFNT